MIFSLVMDRVVCARNTPRNDFPMPEVVEGEMMTREGGVIDTWYTTYRRPCVGWQGGNQDEVELIPLSITASGETPSSYCSEYSSGFNRVCVPRFKVY